MFDHVGLHVRDLDRSVEFYRVALAPLGFELCSRDDSGAGFGPRGAAALWLYPAATSTSVVHLAFRAKDHDAVARFHAAALERGGKDNGAAGLRTDYAPNYFAAFVLDPDGNNVEAVCLE